MTTEKTYEVMLKVTGQQSLAAVIACFEDKNLTCEVVSVQQAAPEDPPPRKLRYANGHRNKGITGRDLVIEVLAEGPKLPAAIERAFMRRGFAASSASPSIARCIAADLIEQLHGGYYQLVTGKTDAGAEDVHQLRPEGRGQADG